MNREDVLQSLNEIYAEEVESAVRYLHLAITLKGLDRLSLRRELLEAMSETLEHAQVVGDKILELGAVPRLRLRLDLAGQLTSGQAALQEAIEFEGAASDAYRELAEKAAGDVSLEDFARAQIALEAAHLAKFRLLLES